MKTNCFRLCTILLLFPFLSFGQTVIPNFSTSDTVCVNAPVTITNTSVGASSYYWNFCVADVNTPPTGFNMGNIGGKLNTPVYVDYVYENGNYYGFLTNNYPGGLLRLDFGNSLLNTPVVTDLGTVGGVIPFNTEGIQIVKNEGKWYLLIVGGDNVQPVPNPAAIVKIELGTNIANNSPVGTNWGNIGNLAYPHDLYVFDDNGHWYGFTVNTDNSTITKFDFTTSFSNTPIAVNLGNVGNLNAPTGIYALQDNGKWYAFVTNANSSTLTRLDFGASLLNSPTGINLGNIGGQFHTSWDIQVMKYCGQNIGFVINAQTNDLIKLDFGNSILNIPTASSFGNVGSLSFPHCLSKIFRVGSDLYTFVANVNNNTLTRIKFTGCTNSSIPNSNAQSPPAVSYNTPGTYNINLTVDDGLPTQSTFCKQVVVLAPPTIMPLQNESICPGNSVNLNPNVTGATSFSWSPIAGLSDPNIKDPIASPGATTQYTLTASNVSGCSSSSSVTVNVLTSQQCASVTPSFAAPDTVCVNNPVNITNTTTGATSYYWNFCTANLNIPPTGANIGNPGGQLTTPCFIDYAYVNGNYYGFITSNNPPSLVRLEFGNSLLNTPTAVNLGNFGGLLPYGAQGIQLVQEGGNWYAIITGGDSVAVPTSKSRILKVDFGTSITNNNPIVTNWGNVGGLAYPTDLYVFKDAGIWYGFTVNYYGNTVTRFNFGSNFNLSPIGTNLGNLGNLNQPSGICPIKDNGTWRIFIANFGSNTLSRIDFGNSLLNAPTSAINLGNLGNRLHNPRDLYIFNYCNESIGFLVNDNTSDLVRLNFTNLSSTPSASSLGNVAGFANPHSISKLFRVGADLFAFVPNSYVNTISRIQFLGCNNANTPNSTLQNPPAVTYDSPGTYNINLMVDEGLPTQSAYCKQVVVLPSPLHSPTQNLTICPGATIKIGSGVKPAIYQWNTSAVTDSIVVNSAGIYWVESDRYGCSVRDSFIVSVTAGLPTRVFNSDTTIFGGDIVQLNGSSPSGSYSWSPASNLNCNSCSNPIASPLVSTTYILTGSDGCGISKDSVRITVMNRTTAPCYGFQTALGISSTFDRGYDVSISKGNEFFVAGVTRINGNDDILISKMDLDGTIIWSEIFGGASAESVRKISPTSDGGLLVTGQSKSFGNNNGDILCFRISNSGSLIWSKRFGVGAANGDLGMDIIETTDGGYALSGILNVMGGVADAVVIKMDNNANLVWTKRFNSSTGEDGVGIVQKGDTLIIASDIETISGNYNFILTKLKLADGSFLSAKKLAPAARGLFNPYIYKNPAAPGYIISGHTIDLNSYANMQHTIITVNDNLDIVNTKLVSVNPVSNDFFTGLVPLPDGSFIGTASSQTNADGYVYRIAGNNTVMYAKKFNGTSDRRIYRIVTTGEEAIAIGGTMVNGQEDFFVANFKKDGSLGFSCDVENASISIQQPIYTATNFTWPTVTDVVFANDNITLNNSPVLLLKTDVCPKPAIDFGFQQNMCFPKIVQFTSTLPGVQSWLWNFGNGQTNSSSLTPAITYADYGTYTIKLNVQYPTGCTDSLARQITIENVYDKTVVHNNDTTICLGDSVLLKTINPVAAYCWKTSAGVAPALLNDYVKPASTTTYILTSQILGPNLVANPDFSLGNSGFTSGYNYTNPNTTEGQYWIGPSSISWNAFVSDCHDHSSGSGNMMMINGSPAAGVKVWSQSFAVVPNTNYNFSVWISSLHTANPAILSFAINNAELGNSINAPGSTCQWKQFFSTWNSGNNTSATISIVNNNTIINGNDFALDDIFFGQVNTKTDSVTINVTGLCDSVKINGTDKVCSRSDTLTYSIYKSPGCTQSYSLQVNNAYADIISQTPTSVRLLFKKNGTTSIKVGYANNCKIVADSLNVSIKFSPTSINFGPDITTCRDTSLILNAGDGFVSYLWQDGSKDSTFTVNAAGNYNVQAQNLCGLQLKDSFRFVKSFVTPFTVSPLSATVCKGDSVQFKANGGTSYAWAPAGNFSQPFAAATKALVSATQNFTVFISDPVCRRDTTLIIPVAASPGATISVTKSNDVNCSNDSAILIASGGVSYTWSPNLYISQNNSNRITVKPYQNITYVVRGKDGIGCFGQDSVTVYFFKEGDQKLFIPTAFTPNGDGKNEIFRPTFTGPYAKYDFKIYNRWGQLVYESKVPGAGWDGMMHGIPQKADIYIFYVTAEGGCNGEFVQKGTFALIR